MIEQTEDVLRVAAQLAVCDGPETQRVKVPRARVAAEEHGVRGVQVQHLDDECADVVGVCAAEPSRVSRYRTNGDVLCVVELYVPVCVGVGGAVEGANVEEGGQSGGPMGWKELVEEGGGAVEQDGLGSEVEVGVFGSGILVAVELVLGEDALVVVVAVEHVGLVTSGVCERSHLRKVGGVERVVVAKEKVAACERCISFEFLESVLVDG